MFDAAIDELEPGRVVRYRLTRDEAPLLYSEVVDLWINDQQFRRDFSRLLADSSFAAFRWETPAVSRLTSQIPFEFVLLDAPGFVSRPTDSQTYRSYFTDDDTNQGVVAFANLRGDATLIVPSPRANDDAYGHLAAFLRGAPALQRDAFWRVVGEVVKEKLGDQPLWLNTAGGGVAWLHVRLDSQPKYYGYAPYKRPA